MVNSDDICELEIKNIAFGGNGVGHLENGMACFVPFSVPGDKLKVRITKVKKKFCEAEIEEILEASADRTTPKCHYYGSCGGCQYQHINYEKQVEIKATQLQESLRRIGGLEETPELEDIISSDIEYNYRNKITLTPTRDNNDDVEYGFKAANARGIVPIKGCSIAMTEVNELFKPLFKSKWGVRNRNREKPRNPTLRKSANDDGTVYYGRAPETITWLKEEVSGKEFRVPLGSFYQINNNVAQKLIEKVASWANELPVTRVIDAFCGSGFLSMGLDKLPCVGIEIDKSAIEVAQHNATTWGLNNHQYIAGDANKLLFRYTQKKSKETLVILDPPRGGCGNGTIKTLLKAKPEYVLYVSCEPSTLARDLKLLFEKGTYALEKTAMLDMFPQTAHFESMVLLKRVRKEN